MLPFYGIDDEGHYEEHRQINIEMLKKLLPVAKENELTIYLENVCSSKTKFVSQEVTLGIIEEIDDENLKMCLDTGHCLHMGGGQPPRPCDKRENISELFIYTIYGSRARRSYDTVYGTY